MWILELPYFLQENISMEKSSTLYTTDEIVENFPLSKISHYVIYINSCTVLVYSETCVSGHLSKPATRLVGEVPIILPLFYVLSCLRITATCILCIAAIAWRPESIIVKLTDPY